jgi:hypothetical protein
MRECAAILAYLLSFRCSSRSGGALGVVHCYECAGLALYEVVGRRRLPEIFADQER